MSPVALTVALVIFLIFGGLALFMSKRGSGNDRTLAVIKGRSATELSDKSDKNVKDKRRADLAKKLKEGGEFESKKKKSTLTSKLEQAGLNISPKQFWLASLGLGIVATIAAAIMGANPFALIMIFITFFLGVPRFIVKRKIAKRQKQFLEEFSDALEAMVRLLKAGMPVTEAINMAGKEFEGPVGEEMARIYEAQKVGISLSEAALMAARRMPLTEMQMFATGVAIQAQTGSSLSEVLMNLAGVIRARFRLKRKVKALASEANASAMIIGSLPFLITLGLYFINPNYIGILFTTPIGKVLVVGSFVWMGIGIFIMKIMINFKV